MNDSKVGNEPACFNPTKRLRRGNVLKVGQKLNKGVNISHCVSLCSPKDTVACLLDRHSELILDIRVIVTDAIKTCCTF